MMNKWVHTREFIDMISPIGIYSLARFSIFASLTINHQNELLINYTVEFDFNNSYIIDPKFHTNKYNAALMSNRPVNCFVIPFKVGMIRR